MCFSFIPALWPLFAKHRSVILSSSTSTPGYQILRSSYSYITSLYTTSTSVLCLLCHATLANLSKPHPRSRFLQEKEKKKRDLFVESNTMKSNEIKRGSGRGSTSFLPFLFYRLSLLRLIRILSNLIFSLFLGSPIQAAAWAYQT